MNFESIVKIRESQFSPPRPRSTYPEEARQEVTVLISDMDAPGAVSGDSDEAVVRELLRQHQKIASPAIIEHDGVVMKFVGIAILAIFQEPKDALGAALTIQDRFHRFNDGKEPPESRHNRISIHHGECIIDDQELFGEAAKVAAGLLAMARKSEILISEAVYDGVKDLPHLHVEQVNRIGSQISSDEIAIFIVDAEKSEGSDGPEVVESDRPFASIPPMQGEYSPCFYCGDRRHPATRCPSKQLLDMRGGLSRLGYLPIDRIQNQWSEDVIRDDPDSPVTHDPAEAGDNARDGSGYRWFLELRKIFQLRFFRAIWSYDGKSWRKIGEHRNDGERGGLIWIGQDCIRVSNLEQAKSILDRAIEKHPDDYRTWCTLAFLSLERDDFRQAKYHLKLALERAKGKPQRIYVLFLLSRLYDLAGDPARAEERIRDILSIEPYCPEAVYLRSIYLFKEGKHARAVRELMNLIKTEREYFVITLIDPELAGFTEYFFPELGALLKETSHEAGQVVRKAEEELKRLEKVAESGDRDLKLARSLWMNIEGLPSNDSYFSSLDSIHYGNSIVTIASRVTDEKRRELLIRLRDLRPRADRCRSFLHYFPYGFMTGNVRDRLRGFQKKLEKTSRMVRSCSLDNFRHASAQVSELCRNLDRIEGQLRGLDGMRQLIRFSVRFLLRALVLQAANLLLFLVAFPFIADTLGYLIPGFDMTARSIGICQKLLACLGGMCAFILAFVMTARSDSEK